MRSLSSLEGEFLMDNRANPGVPDEIVVAQGLPVGAGRGVFEEACYTCSHCQRIVVKNRARTRPRGFCKKCSHILCDACDDAYVKSGHVCRPWKQIVDEALEAAEKGTSLIVIP